MAVTLNYTSKGLLDAIRQQIEQQKREGKISGDTDYKKIINCDFWSTLKDINDSHSRKNKIYHQRDYSCADKGKKIDWKKTVVVYGKAELSDEEWARLINAMGLSITSAQTNETETPEPAENRPEDNLKNDVALGSYSVLLGDLKSRGMNDAQAAQTADKIMASGYKFTVKDDKLVILDKEQNPINLTQVLEIINVTEMKNGN